MINTQQILNFIIANSYLIIISKFFKSSQKCCVNGKVHAHGKQLRRLIGLIGIREIKRLTDERLIEVRR